MHLKTHKFVQQQCFLFHYFLATSMTNWVKMFTDLLFYLYVEINQLRTLVFDNNQTSPVPLNYRHWTLLVIVKDQSFYVVYQHYKKNNNLWKFELNWSCKLRGNNGRKNTLVTRSCVLSLILRSQNQIQIFKWKITSFSKTTCFFY